MDPSSSDDPHFDPTTVAEPDAVPGTDEGIPEVEAIDEDADGDEAAVGLAANTLLSDTTASFSLSERDARAVQDDVDGQIEREVVKLRNAATRVKDDDTAEKGKREGSKRANAKASKRRPIPSLKLPPRRRRKRRPIPSLKLPPRTTPPPTRANVSTRRRT